jgi:4-amino-4-deoxy-L-arabinose transferase-like glycosyltransferase
MSTGHTLNRKRLSSQSTFIYKFFVAPILTAIVISIYYFILTALGDEFELRIYYSLVAFAVLLIIFLIAYRINIIEYTGEHVFVKKFIQEQTFPLFRVNTVNVISSRSRDGQTSYTYQLIIDGPNQQVFKFRFLPEDPNHSISGRPADPASVIEFMSVVNKAKESHPGSDQ